MLELHAESHLDHGISPAILELVLGKFAEKNEFFVATVTLPGIAGKVPCALHGPVTGEVLVAEAEVDYVVRQGRRNASRVCGRDPVQVDTVTIIAGPHDGKACIVFTIFGGPLAPKELGDPSMKPEELLESQKFWAEHALSK